MPDSLLVLALGALAAVAAGVPAWAHLSPVSFWFRLGFPVKAIRVRLTWTHVTASCGLAAQRRRWRWTLDAVPVAGTLRRTSVLLTPRRRVRRMTVPHAPGLGLLRPNRMGWSVRVRLREGQVPAATLDRQARRPAGDHPGDRITDIRPRRRPVTRRYAPITQTPQAKTSRT